MVDHLVAKGYKQSEIYGTTWGDAGVTPVALVDMKCSYVKQIRSAEFEKFLGFWVLRQLQTRKL